MTAPANDDLREIARELVIAAESGEARSFAELREQFGLGHGDLEQALASLREHGKAVEAAPGEWRGPMLDELGASPAEDSRVRVSVGEEDESEASEPTRADGRALPLQVQAGSAAEEWLDAAAAGADVRLTRAIADALDADALGKIVKAGLQGLDPELPFTFEVLP